MSDNRKARRVLPAVVSMRRVSVNSRIRYSELFTRIDILQSLSRSIAFFTIAAAFVVTGKQPVRYAISFSRRFPFHPDINRPLSSICQHDIDTRASLCAISRAADLYARDFPYYAAASLVRGIFPSRETNPAVRARIWRRGFSRFFSTSLVFLFFFFPCYSSARSARIRFQRSFRDFIAGSVAIR